MSKKSNHIHKVQRHTYKKTGQSVYRCTLPDCYFKIEAPFMLGKEVLCNECSNPFIMTQRDITRLRPHCRNCGRTKVTDGEGNERYISKRQIGKVLSDIAANNVSDLRSRLDKASTAVMETENEEDKDI